VRVASKWRGISIYGHITPFHVVYDVRVLDLKAGIKNKPRGNGNELMLHIFRDHRFALIFLLDFKFKLL
jgi:hypothetical protein